MFGTALVPAKPLTHWVSCFFLRDKAARMWSWPNTSNVKVQNKWSYTSVPHTFLHGMDRCFTPLLFRWHTFMKKMHIGDWLGNLKERNHLEGLHSDFTISEWYCCVYIATFHLLRWVLLLQTTACFSPSETVSMLQHIPHTEIGTLTSILQNVTYWDIGTVVSMLQHPVTS